MGISHWLKRFQREVIVAVVTGTVALASAWGGPGTVGMGRP